jgi:hypothetical protein
MGIVNARRIGIGNRGRRGLTPLIRAVGLAALRGTANWTGVGGLRRNFLWSFLCRSKAHYIVIPDSPRNVEVIRFREFSPFSRATR